MAEYTFRRRVRVDGKLPAARRFEIARSYFVRAYGLLDRDSVKLVAVDGKGYVEATITVDGPRNGSKFELR